MKTKHQLLQEWNESTYGLEFGDYVYQYFVSQFNKPPVYGQWIDVKERLPEVGQKVYVALDQAYETIARFIKQDEFGVMFREWNVDSGEYNKVTHWMPLPPSPGSVDVEEKKQHECEFYLITDIAVHSCECGNITVSDGHTSTEYAPLKVDGLGDSSGSEKEEEIAELREKLEEITFYEAQARRQIGIRDQLLEDIFYNRLKPEVMKQKIDDILNLPF